MKYQRQFDAAVNAAKRVGREVELRFADYDRQNFALLKTEDRNSSSKIDKIAERRFREILLGEFPDYGYYGEEFGRDEKEARYWWIVDPIDGTTNMSRRIRYFSHSIGLYDKEKGMVVGVVYNPVTHDLYMAARGEGAFYENYNNISRIKVSDSTDLKNFPATFNINMDVAESIGPSIDAYKKMQNVFRITSLMFSSALDLTQVADGFVAAAVCPRTAPYDHAAGSLIVEEAGGMVVDPNGEKFDPMKRGIIAVNRKETLDAMEKAWIFEDLGRIP